MKIKPTFIKFFKIKIKRVRIVTRRAGSRKDYINNKENARALVYERINYFNEAYGFKFNKISIKNTKSRWGSCSKKGNLNFNYRIVFLPPALADYLVVHELCHLKEFNHSKRFWDLVAEAVPHFKRLKKELRHARNF
jgi:predicted metal-dependent hydrolase